MKKSKFTERQIVNILKEYEAGKSTKDICREHGIAPPTFYSWKRKCEGMDAKQLQAYKALQEENRKLKQMCWSEFGSSDIKGHHRKKALKPCNRKALAEEIVKEEGLSVSRACVIVCLARSQYYYQSKRDDSEVIAKLDELASAKPGRGFDNYYSRIRNGGARMEP